MLTPGEELRNLSTGFTLIGDSPLSAIGRKVRPKCIQRNIPAKRPPDHNDPEEVSGEEGKFYGLRLKWFGGKHEANIGR